jgi:tetratricopeptide (TPR) repeat protein
MRLIHLLSVCLVSLVLIVYIQVGNHKFINFDDTDYVTNNPHVSSGITKENVIWAFTSIDSSNWHPITWISHMADVQVYGMNPRGHHLTNVLIHAMSSVLLLLLLFRITGAIWKSFFVAALFALHPLHVESVAWVAERKDVLSVFFGFLTLIFYSEHVKNKRLTTYILAFFSFILGLMSKPMIITLPLLMLLMDFWPFKRDLYGEKGQGLGQILHKATALLREKLPFFLSSLMSAIITIYAQHKGGSTISIEILPFISRLENALVAYVKYIVKTIWPIDLAVLYPANLKLPFWQICGSFSLLILVTVISVLVGRRHPYLFTGWLWYLITLLPVIGLIQVGNQSMADRYSYLPHIGLFIIAAWGAPEVTKPIKHNKIFLAMLASIVIIVSAILTWRQLGYWRDNISLYRHTLQSTSNNYVIHNNLGVALFEKGELDLAINEYSAALMINPKYVDARYNLGLAYFKKRDMDAATREFQYIIRTNPTTRAHYTMGVLFVQKGDLSAAINEYMKAIEIDPNDIKSHFELALAFARKKDFDKAIHEFKEVLRINPNDIKAHTNLGVALGEKGELDAAIQEFQYVLRINPNDKNVLNNLEHALILKRAKDKAR